MHSGVTPPLTKVLQDSAAWPRGGSGVECHFFGIQYYNFFLLFIIFILLFIIFIIYSFKSLLTILFDVLYIMSFIIEIIYYFIIYFK